MTAAAWRGLAAFGWLWGRYNLLMVLEMSCVTLEESWSLSHLEEGLELMLLMVGVASPWCLQVIRSFREAPGALQGAPAPLSFWHPASQLQCSKTSCPREQLRVAPGQKASHSLALVNTFCVSCLCSAIWLLFGSFDVKPPHSQG